MDGTVNRLDFAIHRCEELISLPSEPAAHPNTRWETWLREDVLPAIESHLLRPSFQRRARWPLETLRPEANTPERQTIEQFQSRLKSLAEVLAEGIHSTSLQDRRRQQLRLVSAASSPGASARTSLPRDFTLRGRLEDPSLFDTQLHQVLFAASSAVPQLINLSDYLLPKSGLFEILDIQNPSAGNAFVVSNPDSLPIGNHLVRRLLREVRLRSCAIDVVRTRVQQELSAWSLHQTQIDHVWREFDQTYQRLLQMFHPSDEFALIESCVACTQLYSFIHPSPDLTWLGLPEPLIASGVTGLTKRFQRYWGSEICHRIVTYLSILKRLPATAETALEEAIATGGLVINQRARTVFWRGREIALTAILFDFLVALGVSALQHRDIGAQDVSTGKIVLDSAMSSRWNRLKNRLPLDLRTLVIPGMDRATYRFMLPAEQVHLIRR